MKRIRKLQDPTPGLEAYLNECHAGEESREGFRNHAASASRRELVKSLATLQRGLCGYCEIDLSERDTQIEHVIPRSDPSRGALEGAQSRQHDRLLPRLAVTSGRSETVFCNSIRTNGSEPEPAAGRLVRPPELRADTDRIPQLRNHPSRSGSCWGLLSAMQRFCQHLRPGGAGAQSGSATLREARRMVASRAVSARTTSGWRCHRLVVSARSRLRS